jgi:hypothetical protein
MQRALNTIEEEVFSMLFAYIHCWATDVFSMGSALDYVSGTEQNQASPRTRMERDLGTQGRRIRLKIEWELL